jgi:hypothetical protein
MESSDKNRHNHEECLVRYINDGSGEYNVIDIFWLLESFKITNLLTFQVVGQRVIAT